MTNQLTLHEQISVHPRAAHSEWVSKHPWATLHQINLMRKRFDRIGQAMLEEQNRHRSHSRRSTRYAIPGEPEYETQGPELDNGGW